MFGKTTLIAAAFLLLYLATASAQYCPGNPDGTSSFDWTAESWNVWIRPNGTLNPVLTNLKSPFHPGSSLAQPNTRHLETAVGMGDYRPEDGWVLIDELMGFSQNDNYTFPQFVLYNRFESKMRYFVYLAGVTQANDVEIVAYFARDGTETHVSAALEHAFTPMDVVENYRDKQIIITVPNSGFYIHGVWAMADIPIAYDPCTCQFPSVLEIAIKTRSYSNFNFTLDGGGDITQVIGAPSSGGSGSSVLNAGRRFANVTGSINTGISKGVSAYRTAEALGSVARQLVLSQANKNLTPGIVGVLNGIPGFGNVGANGLTETQMYLLSQINSGSGASTEVRGAIGSLFKSPIPSTLVPDWLKTAVPFASTAFALLDFIIGGGKSTPPQPMHFNADFSFKGEGTISQQQHQTAITFYTPGSNYLGQTSPDRHPIYNRTMGILNVVEQPVMYEVAGNTAGATSSIYDPYLDMLTEEVRREKSLKLSAPLRYALNPVSGLNLEEIRGAFYYTNCLSLNNAPGIIVDEPGVLRTAYMPTSCLETYSLKSFYTTEKIITKYASSQNPIVEVIPDNDLCQVQLHLMAKLTSPAGKETAWAARYRVNTAPAPYTYENTPPNPYLNVQENVEVTSIEGVVNGTVRAWNTVVVTNDIVVTRGEVEAYLNNMKPHLVLSDDMLGEPIVAGQVVKAPLTIGGVAPNCGYLPPVGADWLSNFCTTPNRYNPILALRTPSEEEEAPVAENKLNLSIAPNPTGDATLLKYNLIEAGPVQIVLSDYTGRQLAELHTASEQAAGEYQLHIPLERYAPGIYVVTVTRPSGKDSVRVVKH